METIYCEKLPRILKSKKILEKKLNIKITNRGKEISIEGKPEDEYIAEKVIDALNFGFPFSHAISIKENDFIFEIICIKDHTKRKDLERIRARIIGTKGKTLKTLSNLTQCYFELQDNNVGIIGPPENIKNAQEALTYLIKGSKQSNVYNMENYTGIVGTKRDYVPHLKGTGTGTVVSVPFRAPMRIFDLGDSKYQLKETFIDVVLECTGIFRDKQSASAHLKAGAKKVLKLLERDSFSDVLIFEQGETREAQKPY